MWAHLAQGEIEQQERGHKLVQTSPGVYEMQSVTAPRQLSLSDKTAILDAYRKNYGNDLVERMQGTSTTGRTEAGQEGRQSTAQIVQQAVKGNSALENFSGAAASNLAGVGAGLIGSVAPQTALDMQRAAGETYQFDPDTKAALAGNIAGTVVPMIPSLANPANAFLQHMTAGGLGASVFGQVREDVAARRQAGQDVPVSNELATAAGSAASTFLASKVGMGYMQQTAQRMAVAPGLAAWLRSYALNAGIQATDAELMQFSQNAIKKLWIDHEQSLSEGVAEAGAVGLGAGLVTAPLASMAAKKVAPAEKGAVPSEPAAPAALEKPDLGGVLQNPDAVKQTLAEEAAPEAQAPAEEAKPAAEEKQPQPALPPSVDNNTVKYRVQDEHGNSTGVPLDFDSPVDKALFVASQPRKGKLSRDAAAWLDKVGIPPEEQASRAADVRDHVEAHASLWGGEESLNVPSLETGKAEPKAEAPKPEVKAEKEKPAFSPAPAEETEAEKPSTKEPAANKDHQTVLDEAVPGAKLKEVPSSFSDVVDAAGKVGRTEVVGYSGGKGRGFFHEGRLFLNVDNPQNRSPEGKREVAMHEAAHAAQKTSPEILQRLADAAPQSVKDQVNREYSRLYAKQEGQAPDQSVLDREVVPMVVGKLMRSKRAFNEVFQDNRGLLARGVDALLTSVRGLTEKGRYQNQILASLKELKAKTDHGTVADRAEVASYLPEHTPRVRDEAEEYVKGKGFAYNPDHTYAKVDEGRAKEIADWYHTAYHDPRNPEVAKSYAAMKSETLDQFRHLEAKGVKFEPWQKEGQPYANSDAVIKDVRDNKHLAFFTGGDLPADHPLAERTGIVRGGQELSYNDVFRAVHDYFGHAKEGVGFGPRGEENAWRSHSQMYSPEARPAMSAETRGQNSWVNYGPQGEANRANPKETQYAEQKATLMPAKWTQVERDEGPAFLHNKPEDEEVKRLAPSIRGAAEAFRKGTAEPAEPKGSFTNLHPDWYGRTLYDWGGGVMLKKGEQAMGASGRKTRNLPIAWRTELARVTDKGELLDRVKALTDEVMPVSGKNGGYTLAPKGAVEKAKAAMDAEGKPYNTTPDETANVAEAAIPNRERPADNIPFLPGVDTAKKFWDEDVKTSLSKAGEALQGAWAGMKRIWAPQTRDHSGQQAAEVWRTRNSDLAQRSDRLNAAFKEASGYLDKAPQAVTRTMIDEIERGVPQSDPKLQGVADAIRSVLDDRLHQVQMLGTGRLKDFVENYFPHLWEDPKKAANLYAEYAAKAPLEGKKGFLKARTLPFFADGIARGLTPVTENPVEALLLRAREMDKYITAQQAMQEMADKGLLKTIKATDPVPAGFAKINDNIATTFAAPSRRGALQIAGYRVAPDAVANVVNNQLSPGLRGDKNFGGLFRGFLGAGNLMNSVQLGLSGFHLAMTTMDSATGKVALALRQAGEGQFGKAGRSLLESPFAAIKNVSQGNKLMKEWFHPGTTDPETSQLAYWMKQAGGRAKMDDFYHAGVVEKMTEAFRKGNYIGAALRAPLAAVELAGKPLMEKIVPRMKMGAFMDMARFELERLGPNASDTETRRAMGKAWDSVDNRMGQLVYDNLFWNKTAKDLAMASTRSVGWNLGTLRELGGGALDFGKAGLDLVRGRNAEFTHRMAYTAAMPVVAGVVGGMIHYLMTGKHPEEIKDYFFPKTGQKDNSGHDVRLALPSYMKDVYSYAKSPSETLKNKVHPLVHAVWDMLSNSDYYGQKIRNEDDPIFKQLASVAKFAGKQLLPFSTREVPKLYAEGQGAKSLLPLIGITKARKDITYSPAELKASELIQDRIPRGTRTEEQVQKSATIRDFAASLRNKTPGAFDSVAQAVREGKLNPEDIESVKQHVKYTGLSGSIHNLGIHDAMGVWAEASPKERREIGPLMFAKLRASRSLSREQRVGYMTVLQNDWKQLKVGPPVAELTGAEE